MSARDEATLSAAERAALAGLETKAEADDPRLAAALRGAKSRRRKPRQVPPAITRASQTWLGPVLAVAGLVITVLALSSVTALAAVGVVVLVVGILLSVGLVRSRLDGTKAASAGARAKGKDHGEGPRTNV